MALAAASSSSQVLGGCRPAASSMGLLYQRTTELWTSGRLNQSPSLVLLSSARDEAESANASSPPILSTTSFSGSRTPCSSNEAPNDTDPMVASGALPLCSAVCHFA